MSGISNKTGSRSGIVGKTVGTPDEFDDDKIQTNLALLAFKAASNGSLAKYDLQDQIIDEYLDETGVNTGDCTNQNFLTGSYNGRNEANTPPVHSGSDSLTFGAYTIQKFDNISSTETLTIAASGNVDIMVVGGGGTGAASYGGGGGAGGLVYKTGHTLTANTYNAVVGDGGAAHSGSARVGINGSDSTWAINGGATEFTAKGGGGGGEAENASGPDSARDGGSGGGQGYASSGYGEETQTGQSGDSGTYGFGNDGGTGGVGGAPTYSTGGGGGAGTAGTRGDVSHRNGGDGGAGKDMSAIFGTAVGDSGWFAGGGGGEAPTVDPWACSPNANPRKQAPWRDNGGQGGGGAGQEWLCDAPWVTVSTAGTDGTGGGSGGGQNIGIGKGGSGIILVRYPTSQTWIAIGTTPSDMTLQSSDTTAEAVPTKADIVMLIEDAGSGVGTVNTHLKAWISRYETGGTKTWTQATLTDEGDWGTDKRILVAHDVDISGQASGTQMSYKITTHSASATYDTRIHATSMGWR